MRTCRRRQRGMSLLEFTLAVLLVVVLVVIAFERMAALQVDMERAAVRHTVAAMREALSLEFARLAARGELGRVREFTGGDALALLAPPPAGYVGARGAEMPAPGTWFHEPGQGTVAYRARFPDALAREPGAGSDTFRWRVVPRWRDSDGDGRYDSRRESAYGLALEPVAPDGRRGSQGNHEGRGMTRTPGAGPVAHRGGASGP